MVHSLAMLGRGARRLSMVLALGILPSAAIAWMGCGDDDTAATAALGKPAPGGTWGAQVAVTVIGRGRVSTSSRSLDCPGAFGSSEGCFTTAIFPNNAADGATGGLVLTAEPTAGRRFLGWSFEAATLGASGRGPDSCNPVTRAATLPSVDVGALSITLPFGEADGTSPIGREGPCAAFKKVPLAYKVVATFEDDVSEGGADANDGGTDPVIYDLGTRSSAPIVLGRSSNAVYLAYEDVGGVTLEAGLFPENGAPQTTIDIGNVPSLSKYRVEPIGLVLQSITGEIFTSRATDPGALVTVGTSSLCRALAMDSLSNVHCRLATSITTWKLSGGSYGSPITVFDDLPSGFELAVDASRFYYDASGQILSLPVDGTDASAPEVVVGSAPISGANATGNLLAGSQRLVWQTATGVFVSSDKLAGASSTATNLTTSLVGSPITMAFDPGDPFSVFAGGSKAIHGWQGAGAPIEVRKGKSFTSMAVGSSFVFYTLAGEKKIFRAPKPGF